MNRPLATVVTEKPRFRAYAAIFAIGVLEICKLVMKQVESYTNADTYLILIRLTPTIVFVQWRCCSVETKILI